MKKFIVFLSFFISFTDITLSQGDVVINMTVKDDIEYFITDKWGRRTGVDPRGQSTRFEEIPGANYGSSNFGDDEWYKDFNNNIVAPQDDGLWVIKIVGNKLTKFDFYINAYSQSQSQDYRKIISAFLDKDNDLTYHFTYYGKGNIPTVKKIVTAQTLIQDITTGGKLNLIGDQNFINSLIGNANRVATGISRGKGDYARRYLDMINTDVNNYYANRTATNYVEKYAYDILIEDMDKLYAIINSISPPPIEQQRIKKP